MGIVIELCIFSASSIIFFHSSQCFLSNLLSHQAMGTKPPVFQLPRYEWIHRLWEKVGSFDSCLAWPWTVDIPEEVLF